MKMFKILVVSLVVTVFFSVPVFAQEVTDPEKVYKEEAFNVDEMKLINDFHGGEVDRANNYIKYLDGVIFNLEEVARIKQEVVTNYNVLSQHNPYYATLIPAAERDLAQAKSWVEYYKAYRNNALADFKVMYNY